MNVQNKDVYDTAEISLTKRLGKLRKEELVTLLAKVLKVNKLKFKNGFMKVKKSSLIEQVIRTKQYDKIDEFLKSKNIESILVEDTEILNEISLTKLEGDNMVKSIVKNENIEIYTENNFLEDLKQKAKDLNLFYDEKDLINFHVAMKISKFVILSGMSGSGKSKLVKLYAEALGINSGQVNFIPVSPSWADDTDLIGYVDSMHNIYAPADSGLVDILLEATMHENNIYIVCLDEMNLARVEHYFSKFLSVLEMDTEDRILSLYNKELESKLYNSNKYPSQIKISDNVLFVGTVNIDESTYHFSDKVLDRANVINLSKVSFKEVYNNKTKIKAKGKNEKEIKFKVYNEFIEGGNFLYLEEKEVELLEELHTCINKVNKNFGVGFRVLNQISEYLVNIPLGCSIAREEGFDIQVVQRILTKIRGPKEQIELIVGSIIDNKYQEGELVDILNKYKDISNFDKSREIINLKARELEFYGYTM
ncbi:MAG: McrB family protein [Sarcina sp.]